MLGGVASTCRVGSQRRRERRAISDWLPIAVGARNEIRADDGPPHPMHPLGHAKNGEMQQYTFFVLASISKSNAARSFYFMAAPRISTAFVARILAHAYARAK